MTSVSLSKREQFRKRLEITVDLLTQREEFRQRNGCDGEEFDESDYPTPLFFLNVAVQCAPLSLKDVETQRKKHLSVDDMMVQLYDPTGQPDPMFQLAQFVPENKK